MGGASAAGRGGNEIDPELHGLVVDALDGTPVVGVRIELLSEGRLLAATVSQETGAFRIRAPGLEEGRALALRAERLGYAPREVVVDAQARAGVPIRIPLDPAPLPLPGFEVEVEGGACPSRHHAEGVALWEAMARAHPDGLDTLGAASYTLIRTDTLASVGGTATPDGPLSAGQRGFSGRLRSQWERRVDREGYAFPIRRVDASGSFSTWSYAPLEADFASHFGTPAFPRHHRLRAPSPLASGGWSLAFCPIDDRRPGLEGRLEISPDTALLRVDWQFRTPEPDEEAGGWTRFPEAAPGDPTPRLLPLESVVWRNLREGGVQRRTQWYEGWIVTPGDSVPFLPDRPVDRGEPLR